MSINNEKAHGIYHNDSEASNVVRNSEMHCSDMNCNESGTPNNPEAECEQQHNDDANGPGDGVGYQTKAEAEDPQKKIAKELKERLKSLFHLIITFHPAAISEIHKILQTSPDFLKQNLFFLTAKPFFRMKTSLRARHECNCDWVYESFEWLKTGEITENCDVSSIMANIENGTCIHYSSRPKTGKTGLGRPASVQLVHAAAAIGFIPVLVTLLSLYADDQPLTHSNKLTPLDIAVFMNDDLSVKTIMTFLTSLRNYKKTLSIQPKRCESIGELVNYVETMKTVSLRGNVHSNAVMYALVHMGGVGLRGALAIGGGVDSMDNDGSSLLQLAVRSADPCVVLDILYYNPSAVFTKKTDGSILMDAMSRDLKPERERGYIGSIAHLLLECGYDVRADHLIHSNYSSLMPRRPQTEELRLRREIVKRIKRELFCPKSLQDCCKFALRKGMAGLRLHAYMSQEVLPKTLRGFVLMEGRLKQNIGHCVKDRSVHSRGTRVVVNCCNIQPMD